MPYTSLFAETSSLERLQGGKAKEISSPDKVSGVGLRSPHTSTFTEALSIEGLLTKAYKGPSSYKVKLSPMNTRGPSPLDIKTALAHLREKMSYFENALPSRQAYV